MAIKLHSFLVLCCLVEVDFAEPFHFEVQEPIYSFVGRQDFLQTLHETLTRKVVENNVQLSAITVVTGRGGIGKTETTRKYIQTYSDAFDNVIWMEGESELKLEKSFRALAKCKIIADEMQIESESESGNQIQERNDDIPTPMNHSKLTDEIIEKIYQVLGREKRRTLMIFDNVDKIPWRFLTSESDLVPPSILILRKRGQSSSSKGQKQMDSEQWLPLGPFTDDDIINYIFNYPNLHLTSDPNDMPEVKVIEKARLLGQLLGGIPLALKQAMAFISVGFEKFPEKGLEKYLRNLYKELKDRNVVHFTLFAESLASELESAFLNPIFLTWKITKEKLAQGFGGNFTTLIMDSLPYFPSSKMSIRLLFYILSSGEEPFRNRSDHSEKAILIKNAIKTLHRYAVIKIDQDHSDPKVDIDIEIDLDVDLFGRTLSMHKELQTAILKTFKEEQVQVEVVGETLTTSKYNQTAASLLVRSEEFLDKTIQENETLSLNELYSISAILNSSDKLATDGVAAPTFEMLERVASHKFKLALWFYKVESFEGEENCKNNLYLFFQLLKQMEAEFNTEKSLTNSKLEKQFLELMRKTFVPLAERNPNGQKKVMDRDLFQRALKFLSLLLKIVTQVLGESHPCRLIFLEEKAEITWRAGLKQESVVFYHQVYDIKRTVFGKERRETMTTLHRLAEKYSFIGALSTSLEIYSQILDVEVKFFGPEHHLTMLTMQNMATVLAEMGDYEKALSLTKSLLEIKQKKKKAIDDSSKGHEKKVESDVDVILLNNMAIYYNNLNNHVEANKIWERLYNIDLKNLGPDDLRTVRHESDIARVLYKLKDYEKASKMQLHVHEIREKLLGPNDPSTMDTKFDLANLYHAQGNDDRALELYTLVYDFRQKTLGEEHDNTLATLDKLAETHMLLEHKETAHEMKSRVYTITKRLHGEESLRAINALCAVAMARAALEEEEKRPEFLENLLPVLKKVYGAKKKILGPIHEETVAALCTLSTYEAVAGGFDRSIKQLEAAYDAISNSENPAQGPDSRLAILILETMSHIRFMQGKDGLGLKLAHKVLDILKKTLDPEHPATVGKLEQLGSIHLSQQNYEEAVKYYEESYSIMTKIYGPGDPRTVDTYKTVGSIYVKQNKYEKALELARHAYEHRLKILGPKHEQTKKAKVMKNSLQFQIKQKTEL